MIRSTRGTAAAWCVVIMTTVGARHAYGVEHCDVTFAVNSTRPTSVLQFEVDYSLVQGTFTTSERVERDEDGVEMSFRDIQCSSLLEDVTPLLRSTCDGAYDRCQWGTGRVLSVVMTTDTPVSGELGVLRCEFQAASAPGAGGFVVTVKDATNPQGDEYAPEVTTAVHVSAVVCGN